MLRRFLLVLVCSATMALFFSASEAQAQQAYGRQWARTYNTQDWQRYYYYPYVYYPHNYYSPEYFRSSEDIYNRYPAEMQVPAYNKDWINFYPMPQRYHQGFHYRLDIF